MTLAILSFLIPLVFLILVWAVMRWDIHRRGRALRAQAHVAVARIKASEKAALEKLSPIERGNLSNRAAARRRKARDAIHRRRGAAEMGLLGFLVVRTMALFSSLFGAAGRIPEAMILWGLGVGALAIAWEPRS